MPLTPRKIAQHLVIAAARPYMSRELPGWGKLTTMFVDYRRDWLWRDAEPRTIIGKRHGYAMQLDLTKWSERFTFFLGRWYDLGIQLVLEDLVAPGQTVIDIGANRGMFALSAAGAVGPTGKVICFEPNPFCVEILSHLKRVNGLDNFDIRPHGLSDKSGQLALSVPRINDGEATFGKCDYADVTEVNAMVQTGDEALAGENPSLLKIDVEGFETKVIAGLEKILKSKRPHIICEVNPGHLRACGSSFQELNRLMNSLGYRGQRIELAKRNRRFSYDLLPLEEIPHGCDALWTHRDNRTRQQVLKESERDERSRQAFMEFASANGIRLKQQRILN